MEGKGKLKISLLGLSLIVAIIIIAVLGFLLYTNNNKTIQLSSNEKSLNAKIAELEKAIDTKKTSEKIKSNNEEKKDIEEKEKEEEPQETEETTEPLSIDSVKGAYEYNPSEEEYSGLYLLENGSFFYNTELRTEGGYTGYYTFNNDGEITLHIIIESGNDIGATIVNETKTVTLENNVITDKNLNRKLEKTDKNPEDCIGYEENIISTHLKSSLAGEALSY